MSRKAYPSDLTDDEWELVQPLLPAESPIGHPRKVEFREILNGIFYVQREGCGWRGLPHDFPPWQTVYNYLRHWQRLGIWQQIHDQLREQVRQAVGRAISASAGIIDSQSVKTTEKRGGWCLEVASRQGSHPAGRSMATMQPRKLKDANDSR